MSVREVLSRFVFFFAKAVKHWSNGFWWLSLTVLIGGLKYSMVPNCGFKLVLCCLQKMPRYYICGKVAERMIFLR